jgi:hypothetical protein
MVGVSSDETCGCGAVGESDSAVVAQDEVIGDLANRRSAWIGMTADGEQELVLSGCEARRSGLCLAPTQEPS